MAYVIDVFDKYGKWDREHTIYRFKVNDREYGIKEIRDISEIQQKIEDNTSSETYCVYSQYEDAFKFVKQIKKLN